jgi:hypothetical protein
MRPGPWKSCHRVEKLELPCHGPPSFDLNHTALCNSILCVEVGRRGGPLTWQPLTQNLNVSFIYQKSKYVCIKTVIANFLHNVNNIEAYHVDRDCVKGPATNVVGGKGGGVRRLTAKSHVT